MPHFGELPTIHHGRHETGGVDEINVAGLHGQTLWVPYSGKIADITHADVLHHFLDLETALTETRKIIAILLGTSRIAGTGDFYMFPNEGGQGVYTGASMPTELVWIIIKDATQRLEYNLSVANDDWDLFCAGYVVEI